VVGWDGEELAVALVPCFSVGRGGGLVGVYGGEVWGIGVVWAGMKGGVMEVILGGRVRDVPPEPT